MSAQPAPDACPCCRPILDLVEAAILSARDLRAEIEALTAELAERNARLAAGLRRSRDGGAL